MTVSWTSRARSGRSASHPPGGRVAGTVVLKAVGRYFGLVPSQDQSGDRNRLGHITGEGPAVVRGGIGDRPIQVISA